jgi:hypothetical protein
MSRMTTTSYRFRIEVPDQPGALARVTDVLAAAGGNVESIDLHEPADGVSVDEIGVQADETWDMVAVAARIDALPGTRVLVQRRERSHGDPVVQALRWAKVMLDAAPGEHELELTRAILEVTGASVAWTTPAEGVSTDTVIHRADALPDGIASEVPAPYWLLSVADDRDDPRIIGHAARPAAMAFSPTEVARLEALLRLRRTLVNA